jgi:putative addiction module killer protein
VLPSNKIEEYLDRRGHSPFAAWSDNLNKKAAAKVAAALAYSNGNFLTQRALGLAFTSTGLILPGYRIYFGKDGERLMILLGGGSKKREQTDISTALARWQDYKQRKGTER